MTTARETSRPRSWLVVKGKTPEAVCNELHLRGAYRGDTTKWNLVGAGSDLGWYLVVAHGREHRLINEAVIARLAAGCEVLTCTVEEQQIYSAAAGWRDGHRLWAIAYDGEEGPSDVVIDGDLPHGSSDIRARFTALAQAEDAGDALVDPMLLAADRTTRLQQTWRGWLPVTGVAPVDPRRDQTRPAPTAATTASPPAMDP